MVKLRGLQVKEEKDPRKKLSVKCPVVGCNRVISGTKLSQLEYNLEVHLDRKHKKGKELQ